MTAVLFGQFALTDQYQFVADTGVRYLALQATFNNGVVVPGLTREVQIIEYFPDGSVLYPTTIARLFQSQVTVIELSALQGRSAQFGDTFRSIGLRSRKVFDVSVGVYGVTSFPPDI